MLPAASPCKLLRGCSAPAHLGQGAHEGVAWLQGLTSAVLPAAGVPCAGCAGLSSSRCRGKALPAQEQGQLSEGPGVPRAPAHAGVRPGLCLPPGQGRRSSLAGQRHRAAAPHAAGPLCPLRGHGGSEPRASRPGPALVALGAASTRVRAAGSSLCHRRALPEESLLTTCWMTLSRKDSFHALFWHPATSPWLGYILYHCQDRGRDGNASLSSLTGANHLRGSHLFHALARFQTRMGLLAYESQ